MFLDNKTKLHLVETFRKLRIHPDKSIELMVYYNISLLLSKNILQI